jgi:hypothetical protein
MNNSGDKSEETQSHEDEVIDAIEQELTDEQLLQMAEGSCSWGANCNSNCSKTT